MVTITKEGMKVLIQDINDKIKDLQNQKIEIQEILKETCEFSIGERVKVILVTWKGEEIDNGFGYLDRISTEDDGNFKFSILKEKKDLTPSSVPFSKYDNLKIEKIK